MNTTPRCLGPIPGHLRTHAWYAPHQAWLRDRDLPHHDPGDADPCRAWLVDTDLIGARLDGACLIVARLDGAWLDNARLVDACLVCASLDGARLDGARLDGARLDGAGLDGARLDEANLVDANLDGIAKDVRDLCYAVPVEERRGLLTALEEGRVDGTIAQRPHKTGADGPAERWALAIRQGDTPETSEICRLTAQWVRETIP